MCTRKHDTSIAELISDAGCELPILQIERCFPAPVIMSVSQYLQDNGRTRQFQDDTPIGGYADWANFDYGNTWSSDLQALSSTCTFMRSELWGIGLRVLKLKLGESVPKLHQVISVRWRHSIQ